MNVKETVDKIKTLLAEARPAEFEVNNTSATEPMVVVDAPVVFELSVDQYNAIEERISTLEAGNKTLSEQFNAAKAENESYKAAFAKHGEVVNQILELVSKLQDQPEATPVEEVKTGFSRFNKQDKEARFARIADSVKAMKETTFKN